MTRSLAAFGLLLSSLHALAQVPIQTGEYKVTTIITAGGAPGDKPDITTRCLKAEDLATPEHLFNNRAMANFKPEATCEITGLFMSTGKVTYATDCRSYTSKVEGTLTTTTYTVVRKTKNRSGGPDVETRIEGFRLGRCKP